jgi:predicted HicB family RNase H-like nuclease
VAGVPLIHYEVPDNLHRRCKVAAAKRGQTLKAFLLAALEAEAQKAEAEQ